jgi:hypothetical protein
VDLQAQQAAGSSVGHQLLQDADSYVDRASGSFESLYLLFLAILLRLKLSITTIVTSRWWCSCWCISNRCAVAVAAAGSREIKQRHPLPTRLHNECDTICSTTGDLCKKKRMADEAADCSLLKLVLQTQST